MVFSRIGRESGRVFVARTLRVHWRGSDCALESYRDPEVSMSFTTRPTLRGYGGAVSAGHYLATQIGAQQLAAGGNAADAACAMGFALQVLEPTQNGPAGEVPILVYDASEDRTYAISGQGPAPKAANIETMRRLGIDRIPPDGLLAATVPAALDAWCRLLEQFGTRKLSDVLSPAQSLAERGFPMYRFLQAVLQFVARRFDTEWPSSAAIYCPVRNVGERQTNPALAAFFANLMEAERADPGGRDAGIRAARDSFYRGRAAEQIEAFLRDPIRDVTGREHAGLLVADDLADYTGRVEQPLSLNYRGAEVWKCGPWTQGPVFLQQLQLLKGFDLSAMGQGSVDSIHTWIECAKLAYADRDANYADPDFAEVPLDILLSDSYATERRKLIDPENASLELRPGIGRLPEGWPLLSEAEHPSVIEPQALAAAEGRRDTTQLVAADRFGNLICATPSGGWLPSSPVIGELGFPIGTRAQMFALDPTHPNALEPGKRPRTTLTPSLARLPDGRRMAFGTPGGDQQDQWTSQFFIDLIDHGVNDLQLAIDRPSVHSLHMPSSFYPRHAELGVVAAENRFDPHVLSQLEARGHRIRRGQAWEHGRVLAVTSDAETGLLEAAASPRFGVAYAAMLP
jgi:gamma-glutamyltranspeptidase/glutathione hydrolase